MVPGAGFEPATSGLWAFGPFCSPDYESGAQTRLGYPGFFLFNLLLQSRNLTIYKRIVKGSVSLEFVDVCWSANVNYVGHFDE